MHEVKVEGPRGCTREELGELLVFLNNVFKPGLDENINVGLEYSHVIASAMDDSENLRVIKCNREIVSHVGIHKIYVKIDELKLKVGVIFGVATHQNYRGKGFATILLKDATEKMIRENYDVSILWTGIPEFYRRLGWENAGSKTIFHFNNSNIEVLPDYRDLEIRKVEDDSELKTIVSLHNETNGVIWDENTAKLLLSRQAIETYSAFRNGSKGYVVVRGSKIIDFSGNSSLILALIRYIFLSKKLGRIEFQVPSNSKEASILKYFGVPFEEDYIGMIKIINLNNLKEILAKCNINVERMNDSYYLVKQCTEERRLDEKQLTKLIFGPEIITQFKCSSLPINFYVAPIDQI
ncbi:MAG: GNAT family N-acetyltransferase [Thermoproteota archaeon]